MRIDNFDSLFCLKTLVSIKDNLLKVKEQIGNYNVRVIASTKYASNDEIREAFNLGIRDFGESYVQDALKKINLFEYLKGQIVWHLIGRLQKNKVRLAVSNFDFIHSIDSLELVELINKVAKRKGVIQKGLLQVNISKEETKTGFIPLDLKKAFGQIIKLQNLKVYGLMTIAPNTKDEELIKSCFLTLANLKNELNKEHSTNLKELSMGMSNDYKISIKCGSTMIRLGRAIFQKEEKS